MRDVVMPSTEITMYSTTWCQDCKRAKKFCGEHRVPYELIDVDQDADGLRVVQQANAGKRIIPTIFLYRRVGASGALECRAGSQAGTRDSPRLPLLRSRGRRRRARWADCSRVRGARGSRRARRGARRPRRAQAGVTERLDNYLGFPEGIGGAEFAYRIAAQARCFGAELLSAEIKSLEVDGQYRVVRLAAGGEGAFLRSAACS